MSSEYAKFVDEYGHAKHTAGVVLALASILSDFSAYGNFSTADEFLAKYPPKQFTKGRTRARTLILPNPTGKGSTSLRQHYMHWANYFVGEKDRQGYPRSPAHATQNWENHKHWIDTLLQLGAAGSNALQQRIIQHVLDDIPAGPTASSRRRAKVPDPVVEQTIEVPPGYEYAVMGVLTYFDSVLKAKGIAEGSRVTISRSGLSITLRIVSPDGDEETIKRTLRQYVGVISGREPVEALFDRKEDQDALVAELMLAGRSMPSRRLGAADGPIALEDVRMDPLVRELLDLVKRGGDQKQDSIHMLIELAGKLGDNDSRNVIALSEVLKQEPSGETEEKLIEAVKSIRHADSSIPKLIYSGLIQQFGAEGASKVVQVASTLSGLFSVFN
ncbi:MAG: hypothetical protein H6737_18595 [Alphaproteobacteria bacterium]|nr:hypothetical protein [Alphaproteobacteria bacterium]